MPVNLQLSVGMADNPRTHPIFEGKVKPDGIDLICTPLHASELFWRQLRFGDFDVSEMSISSLMMAVAGGDTRWVWCARIATSTSPPISSARSSACRSISRLRRYGRAAFSSTNTTSIHATSSSGWSATTT
jgi:hypothetical protein